MNLILQQHRNTLIPRHPGENAFGYVPALIRLSLGPGPIYLRAGEHFVRNGTPGGYGVCHIWQGKQAFLKRVGVGCAEAVPTFIALMIHNGAPLFHDPDHRMASKKRVTLLQTLNGTLVLEPRAERVLGFHYQIITWTPNIKPKGILIGLVEGVSSG